MAATARLDMLITILDFVFHFVLTCFMLLNIIVTLILVITVFIPLKLVVCLCATLFRRDLLKTVAGGSALFIIDDFTVRPEINIICIPIFDGPIDLQCLRSVFRQRVLDHEKSPGNLLYPELKQYWTFFMNFAFWKKDTSFNLNEHVRLYDYGHQSAKELILDETGKGFCDETDLNRVLGPLLQAPWRKGKSPWEFLLIPNFKLSDSVPNNKLGTALIWRSHHGMGDGYSLIKMLYRWMGVKYTKPATNFPQKSMWQKIMFSCVLPFRIPWDIVSSSRKTFDGTHSWNRGFRQIKKSNNVWTSISNPIDVQLIKDIKNHYNVGYNAVLNAAAASSCLRLLEDAGQAPPKEISCFMPIPLPGHPDGLVNHVTVLFLKWPMETKLTRQERLREMSKRMTLSPYNTEPLANQLWNNLCGVVPNVLIQGIRTLRCTVVATSFPGPQGKVVTHGLGANMVDLIASVGPGIGSGGSYMVFISSNGKQRFIKCIKEFDCPKNTISANFGKYIEEELNELKN